MPRPIKGVVTKAEISRLIDKRTTQLRNLQRVSRLQKNFTFGKSGSAKSRSLLVKKLSRTKELSPQAKKKVRFFKFKNEREKDVFVAGIPKGIKITRRKKRRR